MIKQKLPEIIDEPIEDLEEEVILEEHNSGEQNQDEKDE